MRLATVLGRLLDHTNLAAAAAVIAKLVEVADSDPAKLSKLYKIL